jgi:hypothetical protein
VKQTKTVIEAGKFVSEITLINGADAKAANKKEKAKQEDQYQVAGLGEEDVPMTANLLRLLPQSDSLSLDNIESRVTSVSLKDKKMAGASLTTVLSQALQAEDQEQLDWILAQRD